MVTSVEDGDGRGVVEGQSHTFLHQASTILCHTHVVAQVVVAGVGDGEVVPPGVTVLKSLLMNHPHLVGEGLVGEVVDHPTIVNPPCFWFWASFDEACQCDV